ncbi:Zinc finger, ZPR1-type [Trema orientale]|uniref:Zinc finger, ZPR1-type n=1 Tax=Trema orientale TaxID=63057 RepID=A0A2P5DLL4_TREOI|nr:Zinc finger, ZPR1-type [Trema orientale]
MDDAKDQIVDVRSVVEAVSADDSDLPLYQVESLCMRCGQNGITRFLLTLIPYFRKILLSAFDCPHCGGEVKELNGENVVIENGEVGTMKFSLLVRFNPRDVATVWRSQQMLNRQVVKSESATIKIPELDFEIPPEAQRGSLSTVEGILVRAIDKLEALQVERKKADPQTAEAIDQFLLKLKACATGVSPFTFILDDPAGNSFIENPFAPSHDPSLSIRLYECTPEQQALLGYLVDPSQIGDNRDGASTEPNGGSDQVHREAHGSVGAAAGHRAIAQSNSAEIAEALFQYTSPEEVELVKSLI